MRVRTSAAAGIAAVLAIWLVWPAAGGADEVGAAAGPLSQARSELPGPLDVAPGPEADRYRRVLVSPLQIFYSDDLGPERRRDRSRELAPEDLHRFQRYYREAVEKQLGKRHSIATAPNADTLRIETVLLDPVVDKSAWNAPARNVYSDLQTVRLLVLLRDSLTGAVLHKVALPLQVGTRRWSEQNAVTYWGQVRLVFLHVAMRLQWAIDGVARSTSS